MTVIPPPPPPPVRGQLGTRPEQEVRAPDLPSTSPSVIHGPFMPTELITKRGNYILPP